jgi:O-antigen ligase
LSRKFRPLIIAGIIIALAASFFSYSRGAWLALLVGVISYWLIRKQRLLFVFIISIVAIFISTLWLSKNDRYLRFANDYKATIFHTNFSEHLIATYKLKDLSTAERFNRWVAGARMVKDHWLVGYGPNTFYSNYKPYTIPVFKTWVSDNKEHSTVHNYFLLILIEQGVPGLLLFLLLAAGILYYSEKLYKQTEEIFYKTISITCGAIVMMILTVNFLSDLIETDKVGSLFFLCLAMLIRIDINTRKVARDQLPDQ